MTGLSAHGLLQQLLAKARRVGADAAYVTPGAPPSIRLRGALVKLPTTAFDARHTAAMLRALLDTRQRAAFEGAAEAHLPLALDGFPPWPVKAWHHDGAPALMVRLVAPALDEAVLAPVRAALARHDRGLVLLASTSAALRDAALAALSCTCEGTVREPARDQALLERALAAAAARTAVLAADADAAVALLERLAPDTMRRIALGASLRAVVVLHALTSSAGALDAVAVELLLDTPAASAQIVQGDWAGLAETMTRQRSFGMQTLDQELLRLHRAGAIDAEQLLQHARQPEAVRLELALHPAPPARESLDALFGGPPAHADPLPARAPAHADPLQALAPADAPAGGDDFEMTFALRPVQSRAAPRVQVPAPARRPREAVQFRAYAPPRLPPGVTSLVDIWACLPSQAADVARLAQSSGETIQIGLRAGVSIARAAVIGVRLQIAGLALRPAVQSFVWDGEPASVGFPVTVPESAAEGPRTARARLSADGIAIGDLHFVVHVGPPRGDDASCDAGARTTLIRSAFASYATEDRADMLARVHGMKKIAPGLDVFVDAIGLRSGERWQERIDHEIGARERLFLFWSGHAAISPWVDFEWRFAQRTKGIDAIDPVPLADPDSAPPPPELAALHFNDAYVAYIAGARRLG